MSLRDLLLVGSVPLDTVEDVLRATGETIGPWLSSVPDGEVGERLSWTGYLGEHVYAACADLERVSAPGYDNQARPPEHDHHWEASRIDLSQVDSFRVRAGVARPILGDLYAGGVAIDSYRRFARLRAAGTLPEHLRFQVCLPGTTSAVEEFFGDAADWPAVREAYQVAVAAEVQRMLDVIPAEDLTIQIDCAWEVVDLSLEAAPSFPWSPARTYDEKFAVHVDGVATLIDVIPPEVAVGVHWCYGTWGGWPMNEMRDLRLCVDLTDACVRACRRRLDYVHMPVTPDADAGFVAPLAELADVDCKVYLGLLDHRDGLDGFRRRWKLAREHLPGAGVAAVCGFGREGASVVPAALALHRQAAIELGTGRAS